MCSRRDQHAGMSEGGTCFRKIILVIGRKNAGLALMRSLIDLTKLVSSFYEEEQHDYHLATNGYPLQSFSMAVFESR